MRLFQLGIGFDGSLITEIAWEKSFRSEDRIPNCKYPAPSLGSSGLRCSERLDLRRSFGVFRLLPLLPETDRVVVIGQGIFRLQPGKSFQSLHQAF